MSRRKSKNSGNPQPQDTPQTPPKQANPKRWPEDYPDHQARLDFRDIDNDEDNFEYALRFEQALALESEFELELEEKLKEEAPAEPWAARFIKQGWAADPYPRRFEDFHKYRTPPDALAAMNLRDPFETMLAAQLCAIHSNMLYNMRRATEPPATLPETEVRYKIALKLTTLYCKGMDTLAKYRRGGEQKVSVKYERVQRRKGRRAERHRLTISRKGSGPEFDPLATSPEATPVTKAIDGAKPNEQ